LASTRGARRCGGLYYQTCARPPAPA